MKSQYGDRDTVGTTYLQAQNNSVSGLSTMEMSAEMAQGLTEDINETIQSNPFHGEPFYINVVEERDLQMKNAFKRRIFKTKYLPYPEDNTLVFFVEPKKNRVSFCWDIPHHSEFFNILSNFMLYDKNYIDMIRDWRSNDLSKFGYIKVSMNSAQVEGYDKKITDRYKENYIQLCINNGMDEKGIEVEKKLGFFWIPNKFFKFRDLKENTPRVSLLAV